MVDNVIISGIDSKIPKWATENTLKLIQADIRKLVGGTSSSSPTSKKMAKEEDVKLKKLTLTNKEDAKHSKQAKDFFTMLQEEGLGTKDAVKQLQQSLTKGSSAALVASESSGMLSTVFEKVTGPTGLAISAFALLGESVIGLKNYVEHTFDAFIQLYDTGLTFQKGLFDFRLAATEAALPLDEFAKLLTENSAVVASFGTNGGRALGQLSLQTRKVVYDQMQLGVSYQDINGYLGSYLETLRMQGFLDKNSRTQQAQGGAEYIKELTLYSQVLGKSRKQIDDEVKKAVRRPDVFAKLQSIGGDLGKTASDSFRQASAAFAGVMGDSSSEFNDAFSSLIVSLNPYETDTVKTLIASGNQQVAQQLIDFSNAVKSGTMSQDDVNKGVTNIVEGLRGANVEGVSRLIETRSQFQQGATSLAGIMQNVKSIDSLSLARLKAGQAIPVDPFTASIQRIGEIFREVKGNFEQVFASFIQTNMGTFEKIAGDIANYAADFAEVLKGFLGTITKLFDENTRAEAVAELKSTLLSSVSSFVTSVLDVVFEYIKQKINPFSRSTDQYLAQQQSIALAQKTFGALPKTPENIAAKDAFLAGLNKENFVNKQTGFFGGNKDAIDALNSIIVSSKKAGIDASEILKPILDTDEKFKKSFTASLAMPTPPELPSLNPTISTVSGINYNRAGTSINGLDQVNASSGITDNTAIITLLGQQNQYLQTLISVNSDSKDSLDSIAAVNSKSSKSLLEVNRSIRTNSNTIR